MPNTIDGALAYAQEHPTRDGRSWAGWCESFIYRAGGFTRSFASALLAGNASGHLNPNWAQAPRGTIHYWAGVGGDGHVAFELGGGTLLMASGRVGNLGTSLGTIHFTDYAKLGIPYRGWTMRHGDETLAGASATASATITPLTPKEDEDMFKLIPDAASDTIFVVGPTGKRVGIQNTYHLGLLQRFNAQTELLPAEIDLLAATYLSKIN